MPGKNWWITLTKAGLLGIYSLVFEHVAIFILQRLISKKQRKAFVECELFDLRSRPCCRVWPKVDDRSVPSKCIKPRRKYDYNKSSSALNVSQTSLQWQPACRPNTRRMLIMPLRDISKISPPALFPSNSPFGARRLRRLSPFDCSQQRDLPVLVQRGKGLGRLTFYLYLGSDLISVPAGAKLLCLGTGGTCPVRVQKHMRNLRSWFQKTSRQCVKINKIHYIAILLNLCFFS